MRNLNFGLLRIGLSILAGAVLVSCAGNTGTNPFTPPAGGSVVTFGTDAPICDVESFTATITSAALVPQSGTPVTIIDSTNPATVDFARLEGFTNILSAASASPGTYTQLQMTLANPQLVAINTATSPPSPVSIQTTLTTSSFTVPTTCIRLASSG